MDELARILAFDKLQPFIKPEEVEVLLETMNAAAIVVEGLPDLSQDPGDNAILATAIAGKL